MCGRRLAGNEEIGCLWEDKGGGECGGICGGFRPLCGRARFGFAETLLFVLGIIFYGVNFEAG